MATPHDALWHLNNDMPIFEDYGLGTELNLAVDDITNILADQVLNRADMANLVTNRNVVLDVAAGLAVSGTDLKLQIANAFHYTINGGVYLKAITAAITVTVAAALECAASKYAAYLVTINATGAVALIKAADADSTASALAAVAAVTIPADVAPVGVIHIQNNATLFNPGSATDTYGDFADDTTADTYVDFIGVAAKDLGAAATQTDADAYTQVFTTIS